MKWLGIAVLMGVGAGICGYSRGKVASSQAAQAEPPAVRAMRAQEPVKVDGVLDDEVWKHATSYPLSMPDDQQAKRPLTEGGQVQIAWDDHYVYLAARFVDSDVVAEGTADQLHHYQLGDVCELFLKPADASEYWELYVTPRGNKTTFRFPGRGRFGLPSTINAPSGLIVAAAVQGTVNDYTDRDEGWTAEMAMPIRDLTAHGSKLSPGTDWRILIGRYNYSVYLPATGPELSTAPHAGATNFHMLEQYGRLEFAD